MQSRLKSPVLWTSLIAAVALLLKAFGVYAIDDATLSTITGVALSLLVALGIVNDPTSKNTL